MTKDAICSYSQRRGEVRAGGGKKDKQKNETGFKAKYAAKQMYEERVLSAEIGNWVIIVKILNFVFRFGQSDGHVLVG